MKINSAILSVRQFRQKPCEELLGHWELVYADSPLTDYDIKRLPGSSAVQCWPAQSPFLCLWSTRGLHSLIPMAAHSTAPKLIHKRNLCFRLINWQSLVQLLFPVEIPNVTCYENTRRNKIRDVFSFFKFTDPVILIVDAQEGNALSSIRARHCILLCINVILQVN